MSVEMSENLKRCLDDLEERIDPETEENLLREWIAFAEGRFEGDLFSPRRGEPSPPNVEWEHIRVNATLDDFDMMARQQYKGCSDLLANGDGLVMAVRANYGTSILPSLYGAELFIMEDTMDTLPTSWPLTGADAIRRIADTGVPDLNGGLAPKVFEMTRRFAAIAREYPKIGRYVHIYHPDLQGPMDICELLWGSAMFYALLEDPGLVKVLLEGITQTYAAFLNKWLEIVPLSAEGNVHWGLYHRGMIMLRDDSAMNLSPGLFDEFVRPYDQRLLDTFGGGAIHFCGRGDHYVPRLAAMDNLFAINLSQPELNDMETIYRNTIDKGIPIIGLDHSEAQRAQAAGRNLHGRVHCM